MNNSNFDSVSADQSANTFSSSNVLNSSTGSTTTSLTEVVSSYSTFQSNTSNPSERINPFDKTNISSTKPIDSTPSTYSATSTNPAVTSSLDDLTKNRFEKYQGVQNQVTGRYVPSSNTSDAYGSAISTTISSTIVSTSSISSDIDTLKYTSASSVASLSGKKTEETTTTTTTASSSDTAPARRTDAAKYAFGTAQYSTGSMSDSEIIFGSNENLPDLPVSNKRSFGRSSFSTTMDATDSIYATRREESRMYNRSLSVSSETDGDFAHDPRVNTSYRIYEGIQNAAFQDFDSPVKTSAPPASTTVSDTYSKYSSSYTNQAATDDDEYDLK